MGVGDNDSLKVYVRLPVKIKEELQIKDLHPDIDTVVLPRQKSRRWCFIVFKNEQIRDKVINHLKEIKIKDKHIVIKPFKIGQHKSKEKKSKSVVQEHTTESLKHLLD